LITKAQNKPEGDARDGAIGAAEKWPASLASCLPDLGWWVPTLAALASAFALPLRDLGTQEIRGLCPGGDLRSRPLS